MGAKELANELISFVLACMLLLPVPNALLAPVSEADLLTFKGPVMRDGSRLMLASVDAKVPNIAFRYTSDVPGRARLLGAITAWAPLGRLYGFDAWIANVDRHAGNLLFSARAEAWLIDHGWAFTGPDWTPADLDPRSAYQHRLHEWLTPLLTDDGRETRGRQAGAMEADLKLIDIEDESFAAEHDLAISQPPPDDIQERMARPARKGFVKDGMMVCINVSGLKADSLAKMDIRAVWSS